MYIHITFTANITHIYTLHKFNYIKYGNLKIYFNYKNI